jgi:DNA-binding transcriptional ArsR family regulator
MVKLESPLDDVFAALASPVRRQTLDALQAGARSASELAAPHAMSLVGFMKHLRVLRDAGLVSCRKEGRTVTCRLERKPLSAATRWLASREKIWNSRLDALGRHLYHGEQIEAAATKKKKAPHR